MLSAYISILNKIGYPEVFFSDIINTSGAPVVVMFEVMRACMGTRPIIGLKSLLSL